MKEVLQENLAELDQDKQSYDQNNFEEYKKIFQLTRRLGDIHQSDNVFKCIVNILKKIVEFSGVALIKKEQFSDSYYLEKDYKLNGKLDKHLRWLERSGYLKWVCESDTVSLMPPAEEVNSKHPILIIPLLSGKKVVGALVVFLKLESVDLTSKNSDLLTLLGAQAGMALENARLYEETIVKNQVVSSIRTYLENSIESVGEGIIAIDTKQKVSLFNSAAGEIFGAQYDQAIGSHYSELFDLEFVEFLDGLFETTLTTGESKGEYSYLNPVTHKILPLEMHATVLKNAENEDVGVIAVCRDLTEHQELFYFRKLDQLKDEFISTVSHELRTPLTSIKSFVELLKDFENCDSTSRKEFLDIIDKESNRLIQLIEELLDISKINRGDFDTELSIVNVDTVFRKSLLLLQAVANKKNITFDVNFDGDLVVLSDDKRLMQVFVNLIGNAIKFSPEGSTIKIWSEELKSDYGLHSKNFLKIAIQDEGIGIDKNSWKTIFEKFKQIREDPSTKPNGSGLGLWLCKQIIHQHGGKIWVESERKKGSIFFLTLQHPE